MDVTIYIYMCVCVLTMQPTHTILSPCELSGERREVLCLTPSNGKIDRGQESGIILPLEFLWRDCVLITKYNPLSEHVSNAYLNQSRTGSHWKIKHVFCTLSEGSHCDMCCFVAVCQRSASTSGQYLCPGTRNFPMFRENRKIPAIF